MLLSEAIKIREGTKSDSQIIHNMIQDLAEFERENNEPQLTVADIERDGFELNLFSTMLAEHQEHVVGMAIYYPRYSTWKGKVLYLEDLFVLEEYRSHGTGLLLMEKLIERARAEGYVRLDWQVLKWNRRAIDFYERFACSWDDQWYNGSIKIEQL